MEPVFSLALVHNGDEERLEHVRPAISLATRTLSLTPGASYSQSFEVFRQPPVAPHSRRLALRRRMLLLHAFHLFEDRIVLRPRSRWARMKAYVAHVPRYVVPTSKAREWLRASAIEVIVTDKHLEAWRTFVDQGNSYLVVLEDDVVFPGQFFLDLGHLAEQIKTYDPEALFYMDLAGGIAVQDLPIRHIDHEYREGWLHLARPTPNTSCAYVMSVETVRRFLAALDERPWYRHLPIDWLVATAMLEQHERGAEFPCLHALPPILGHGSVIGAYESWQPED